jgi:hypothetical protein
VDVATVFIEGGGQHLAAIVLAVGVVTRRDEAEERVRR